MVAFIFLDKADVRVSAAGYDYYNGDDDDDAVVTTADGDISPRNNFNLLNRKNIQCTTYSRYKVVNFVSPLSPLYTAPVSVLSYDCDCMNFFISVHTFTFLLLCIYVTLHV